MLCYYVSLRLKNVIKFVSIESDFIFKQKTLKDFSKRWCLHFVVCNPLFWNECSCLGHETKIYSIYPNVYNKKYLYLCAQEIKIPLNVVDMLFFNYVSWVFILDFLSFLYQFKWINRQRKTKDVCHFHTFEWYKK